MRRRIVLHVEAFIQGFAEGNHARLGVREALGDVVDRLVARYWIRLYRGRLRIPGAAREDESWRS